MKPLSPSRMADPVNPKDPVDVSGLVNFVNTMRLLTAFSVATLLGAPLTLGQEEPVQEPASAPEQVEASLPSAMPSTEAYERGLRHYRNRNFTEALGELGQVSQAEPDRADVLYLMGYCHYVLKHFEDSLDAFRRTFQADPDFDPRGIYQARYRPQGP